MIQHTKDGPEGGEVVPVKFCSEVIHSWSDISDNEKLAFLAEMPKLEHALCPDVPSWFIKDFTFYETYFELEVGATDAGLKDGVVYDSVL